MQLWEQGFRGKGALRINFVVLYGEKREEYSWSKTFFRHSCVHPYWHSESASCWNWLSWNGRGPWTTRRGKCNITVAYIGEYYWRRLQQTPCGSSGAHCKHMYTPQIISWRHLAYNIKYPVFVYDRNSDNCRKAKDNYPWGTNSIPQRPALFVGENSMATRN